MKQYANVSNTNSKLGGQILSINMPAGITCRPDAPCYKGCYAKHGHWMYNNVQNRCRKTLNTTKKIRNFSLIALQRKPLYRGLYVGIHRVISSIPNTSKECAELQERIKKLIIFVSQRNMKS